MADVIQRAFQFTALILSPVLIIMGMAFIRAVHEMIVGLLPSFSFGIVNLMVSWLATILSIALFCLLIYMVFRFVASGGKGVFQE